MAKDVALRDDAAWSKDLIREIAADIGKAVAHHIETMYPDAVTATSKNMLVSVRGSVQNEIMAALGTVDEDAIRARLAERKATRRRSKAFYRSIRDKAEGLADGGEQGTASSP